LLWRGLVEVEGGPGDGEGVVFAVGIDLFVQVDRFVEFLLADVALLMVSGVWSDGCRLDGSGERGIPGTYPGADVVGDNFDGAIGHFEGRIKSPGEVEEFKRRSPSSQAGRSELTGFQNCGFGDFLTLDTHTPPKVHPRQAQNKTRSFRGCHTRGNSTVIGAAVSLDEP
jgi:hypothetical protein